MSKAVRIMGFPPQRRYGGTQERKNGTPAADPAIVNEKPRREDRR